MDNNTELFIRTVPHTGTHFMLQLLRENGFHQVTHMHFGVPIKRDIYPIISTIRDPVKTYITWISRDRDWDFLTAWRLFNDAYHDETDLHIVPVDTPDREIHLASLGERLGRKLKTDWKPVTSKPHKENIIIPDLSEVYALPVVQKFYGPVQEKIDALDAL